jgi:alkanesulfonate monooxygenase SsuD/methylene tetrahydromethanopterin reductase-like flavin-dependent oxidoreductase (luciferase family)
MTKPITFGWRVPDFPEYGADSLAFREHIFQFMDLLNGAGWDAVWTGDHFFPWAAELDQALDTIESWTTITYLLAKYPRMRYGTIVLSQAYRPPAALAKMAAIAQWLSGGRFILGIGAGWKENEYRAYGYEYPGTRERLNQLEEAVQIIRKMWHEDAPTFHGKYYHIDNATCNPRPDPLPPLLVGGTGPQRTLKIVAKYADWCNLNNSSLDEGRTSLEVLRQHCQAVGRDYDEIVKSYACDCFVIGATPAEVERIQNASFFTRKNVPIAGTPDEIVARLQPFIDLGVTHFILRFADFPHTDGAELFIKEVLPRFKN